MESQAKEGTTALSDFLPEEEAAQQLFASVRTLRYWRQTQQGPPFVKVGGKVLYRSQSLRSWIDAIEVKPAVDQSRRRVRR